MDANQPPPTPNERSLKTLLRSIQRSQGQFSLILARCNYASLRETLVPVIQDRSPTPIDVVVLSDPMDTLYSTIQTELADRDPASVAAIMVLGLETLTAVDQVLTSAMMMREEFGKNCPYPLILWVNDRVLQKLTRLATDLKNWAAVPIEFKMDTSELIRSLQDHADRLFASVLEAGEQAFFSKQVNGFTNTLRRSEMSAALNDIFRSQQPLEPAFQASLDFLLGQEAHSQGELETARTCYQSSLAFWQEAMQAQQEQPLAESFLCLPSPMERAACVLVYLGMWWRSYAILQRSAYVSACRRAWQCFRQSLTIFERANRQDLVSRFIISEAEVLQKLQQWDELEVVARNALVLHKLYVDPVRQARDLGFLAEVAIARGQWQAAKEHIDMALEILHTAEVAEQAVLADGTPAAGLELAERYHYGWYLLLLSSVEEHLGQSQEMLAHLEEARMRVFPADDPHLHIQILQMLRHAYFRKQRYLDAFYTKRDQRSLEQQYGFRAFVGALRVRLQPPQSLTDGPILAPVPVDPDERLAQDIEVSGRQQDVQKLLARMGRRDYKLTVIHGPSGVGKSAIVNAGFIPALKERQIGDRVAVPVTLDSYTDWEMNLDRHLSQAIALPMSTLRPDADSLLEHLRYATDHNFLPVLVLDQFEEFFFVWKSLRDRRPFYNFLRECLNLPFVKLVLCLREDYLHYLLEFQRLTDLDIINNDILSKEIRYPLGDFSRQEAKQVIQNLTTRAQFFLEDDLIDALVNDLAKDFGTVRPIELQVVGAQLQSENITTLEQYQNLGPKEKLVERSLEDVVQDCGPENEQAAWAVLGLLTNEDGTRPLKTDDELAAELIATEQDEDVSKLDLVLRVLEGSGLVLKMREEGGDRYQLVHDYLVSFIRDHQMPLLRAALVEVTEKKRYVEAQLAESLQQQYQARQRAEIAEISALSSLSQALLLSNAPLDALVASVKAGKRLQEIKGDETLTAQVLDSLRQAIGRIQERNRIEGHRAPVNTIRFSPDGQTIASASGDSTVKLWKRDGTLICTLEAHSGSINTIEFSPDGQLLASASRDKTIKLWQMNGRLLASLERHASGVCGLCFSPDGTLLASCSADRTIKLWTIEGRELRSIEGHEAPVWSVRFSPDGQRLVSSSSDRTIRIWGLDGRWLDTLRGHTSDVFDIAFSPDGTIMASASGDGSVKLWRTRDGWLLKTVRIHSGLVTSVAFSPDGRAIASSSWDTTVKLWNLNGRKLKTLKGHFGKVQSVRFSPDGETIASGGSDRTIRLWSRSNAVLEHSNKVHGLSFSPNGQMIASGGQDSLVNLWDKQGNLLRTFQGHAGWIWSLSFSPDGQIIASAGSDETIKLWQLDGTLLQTIRAHTRVARSLAFHPEAPILASGGNDHLLKLWKLDGTLLQTIAAHEGTVTEVNFSPDGRWLASCSKDGTAKLWSLDGTLVRMFEHWGWVWSVEFSPDSKTLITSGGNEFIKLWKLDGTLIRTLEGHGSSIQSVRFSPNGKLVASAGGDETIKLWTADGTWVKNLRGHSGWIRKICFSPDGNQLASASDDTTVILWDLESSLEVLLQRGVDWLQDYLNTNPHVNPRDRAIVQP